MTLNRRALLLIFPVILAGFVFAAWIGYMAQRSSILGFEQARLAKRLAELQSAYQSYAAFNKSFLYTLTDSSALRLFLSETDGDYRSEAIGIRIQESVARLADETVSFVSCAIVQPDLGIAYYFESSLDPFAEMGAPQRALARLLVEERDVASTDLIQIPDGGALLVSSTFVLPGTFGAPLPSQKTKAYLVQIAVRPDRFESLRNDLAAEYEAAVELSSKSHAQEAELAASVQLAPELYARLTPSPSYLSEHLKSQQIAFGLGGLTVSCLTIALLLLLLRRYITAPISLLDRQLTEVMAGRQAGLVDPHESGEIGRLAGNMKTLHDSMVGALERVREISWTDPLTRIGNRAHFNSVATRMLADAGAGGEALTLLFVDLDNFKLVNDKYGHEEGDALLKSFAEDVRALLAGLEGADGEPIAAFARLSGDEFALLVRSRPVPGAAERVANAIIALFADGYSVGGRSFPVTASIGIASFPDDAASIGQLIFSADAAMYEAKAAGKNQVAPFSRKLAEKNHRMRLVEDELKALDPDSEFRLVYMPVVDRAGRVVACEALLRWTSPTLGQVSPVEFIPIAETKGLFSKIDHWVADRAMADHRRLQALFGPELMLAINISSAELHTRTIGAHLADCARRHGVDPRLVEIELTETFAAELGAYTEEVLMGLRQRGFRIAIDDFGVGYTSIRQILEYPADTIKLDSLIVRRLTLDGGAGSLSTIVAFCKARGLAVVAEGVDSEAKLERLLDAGCDYFQGYLVTPPLGIEDLHLWQLRRAAAALKAGDGAAAGDAEGVWPFGMLAVAR